jgi:hypothetical protein
MNDQSGQLALPTHHLEAIYAETGRSSAGLANAINQEHYLFQADLHHSLQRARRIGELLVVAKAKVKETPSGRWLAWLKQYCPQIPERTASAYMKVARQWEVIEEKSATIADFSLRDALGSVSRSRKSTAPSRQDRSFTLELEEAIISLTRRLKPFLDPSREDQPPEQCSRWLNELADLESTINHLRRRLAERQMTGPDSTCPDCGDPLLAGMASCLCGWNTGALIAKDPFLDI